MRTVILDGHSKICAMTGWRLEHGVLREELAGQITRLMTNSNSCTAASTQYAGMEALTSPRKGSYKIVGPFRESSVIIQGPNEISSFKCLLPKGASHAFPNIEGTGKSSKFPEGYLLDEAGVVTSSGASFEKSPAGRRQRSGRASLVLREGVQLQN